MDFNGLTLDLMLKRPGPDGTGGIPSMWLSGPPEVGGKSDNRSASFS